MVTKATRDVLDLATRAVQDLECTGGHIDGTPIGSTTPSTGRFTNLSASGNVDFSGATLIGTLRAKWGDIAEYYLADADYPPGTLVDIGGEFEITATTEDSQDIFGVVTTNPTFILNSPHDDPPEGAHWVAIGLVGRVPVRVVGLVNKGDRLIASEVAGCAQAASINGLLTDVSVLGRALTDSDSAQVVLAALSTTK